MSNNSNTSADNNCKSIKKIYKKILDNKKNLNYKEVIENYKKLIELKPPSTNRFLKELGEIYEIEKMYYEAVECYVKILNTEKKDISIIGVLTNQIGTCYFNINQFKLAIHYFKKVIQIKEIPDVYANIALCNIRLKQYKEAEAVLLHSYTIDNSHILTTTNLGEIYYHTKRYKKSIEFIEKNLNPNNYSQLYNLSFSYLSDKQFKKGFHLYENRLKSNTINPFTNQIDRLDVPLEYWNGTDNCRHLLIVSEQGLGDNIQYYRFIIELSEKYPEMKITYFCKKDIFHIFKKYGNIEIIQNTFLFNYDYKLYIMSLPYILQLSSIIPNRINYININEEKEVFWNNKLKELSDINKPRLKVGFVYNGLLTSFIEKYIPLKQFEILCDLDIDLICIHRKSDLEKDKEFDEKRYSNKIHFLDIDKDLPFDDTVHILKNLDLLITIDTYIVHLAGILNIKTWLLLGISEWRWSDDPTKTYWYDSVELIRTKEDQSLSEIIPSVKDKLTELLKKE